MTATIEDRVYFGVHHHLHQTNNGVLIRRTRERLSMVADRGQLNLTVVDSEGQESTVSLDVEQVGNLIESLPVLRNWMLTGEPSAY
uniref:hypothetical protein n=1 Tax=Paractinoplanes polyasparticus TaxID=2856853 RepID=UPI001C842EBC|nr:hypothetical protein [Actinoplanes polyasparticus]